jgi:hypothetical protein
MPSIGSQRLLALTLIRLEQHHSKEVRPLDRSFVSNRFHYLRFGR